VRSLAPPWQSAPAWLLGDFVMSGRLDPDARSIVAFAAAAGALSGAAFVLLAIILLKLWG
jgi:hypothetical protein